MTQKLNSIGSRDVQVTQFPDPGYTINEPTYSWRNEVEARFEELVRLPQGWDGYRGVPVPFQTAFFSVKLLSLICRPGCPAPDIFPGSGGEVQLEWHFGNVSVELYIRGPNDVVATRKEKGKPGEEVHLSNIFTLAAKWLQDMHGVNRAATRSAA